MQHAICLVVAYDGADFAGFVRQPRQRTVQGELETAIAVMNGAEVDVRGAGRTDSGVHAIGQVVAFDPVRTIPPSGWVRGLNRTLPDDVVVTHAELRPFGYNPRFDARNKTYRYLLQLCPHRDPLMRRHAWWLGKSRQRRPQGGLDLDAMRTAAACLVGTHDFHAFRQADDDRKTTTRTMLSIEVVESYGGDPRLIAIEVTGTAFMKNMVRILAGTLVAAGGGRLTTAEVAALLLPSARREDAGMTAPAHGLTLVSMRLGRNSP